VFRISHLGAWSSVWEAKPIKAPSSDGIGYQQTSISKTILPHHARWDVGLLNAQPWLRRLGSLYSMKLNGSLYSMKLKYCTPRLND